MSDEANAYELWHAVDLSRKHLPDGILGNVITGYHCADGIVLHTDTGNFLTTEIGTGRHRIFDDGTGRLDLYENGELLGSRATGQSYMSD